MLWQKKKISHKKMERAALINLAEVANALGPHIKKKTIVDQGGNREKQIEGPGRKSPSLPMILEEKEVTYVECEKNAKEAPTYTIPRTTTTSPTPPPPYPTTPMREEKDIELCSGVYSTIQDVEIINIP